MIREPGVYDISESDYDADNLCAVPTLRSSLIKILETDNLTPRHVWHAHPRLNPAFVAEHSDTFDIGKACHELVLKGDAARITVVNAGDWRTKDAQAFRRAARAEGKLPLLVDQAARAAHMERAVRQQMRDLKDGAANAFSDGRPEMTLLWPEEDLWCRVRLDWLPNKSRMFWDFKSTDRSAEPESWCRRSMVQLGFDIQAAFYLRGIRAVLGYEDAQFGFIVAEQSEPFGVSAIGVPPAVIANADKKIDRALSIWARCLATNEWPAYDRSIYWGAEVPAWDAARQELRDFTSASEMEVARKMWEPL